VYVDESVLVPLDYVQNGEVILNISYDATSNLSIKNDCLSFKARFSGSSKEIWIPIENVLAIYARENGQGMAFPRPEKPVSFDQSNLPNHPEVKDNSSGHGESSKPKLTRIK